MVEIAYAQLVESIQNGLTKLGEQGTVQFVVLPCPALEILPHILLVGLKKEDSLQQALYDIAEIAADAPDVRFSYVHQGHSMTYIVSEYKSCPISIFVHPYQVNSEIPCESLIASIMESCEPDQLASTDPFAYRPRIGVKFAGWLSSLASGPSGSVFLEALQVLLSWGVSRRVLARTSDNGFPTSEVFAVMLAHVLSHSPASPLSALQLVKDFFRTYSTWRWNEASVAAWCGACGADSEDTLAFAGRIASGERIDSDDENEKPREASNPELPILERGLSAAADENDEVHPHKRLRFELGRIRDLRRHYDVEDTRAGKIGVGNIQTEHEFKPLDRLDVMTVLHPSTFTGEDRVNLAVRVLESHRKLFQQEVFRAHSLLTDTTPDDDQLVSSESLLMAPLPFRESTIYILISVSGESPTVRWTVSSVVESQLWFLIQELEAYFGVMLVPSEKIFHDLPTIGDRNCSAVILGVNFPKEDPYRAKDGIEVDLASPIARLLTRTKQQVYERLDFKSKLEGRFTVSAKLVREIPNNWKL